MKKQNRVHSTPNRLTPKNQAKISTHHRKEFALPKGDVHGSCVVIYNRQTKSPEIKVPFTEDQFYNLIQLQYNNASFHGVDVRQIIAFAVRDFLAENNLATPDNPDAFALPGAGAEPLCICLFDRMMQAPLARAHLSEHEMSDLVAAAKRSEYTGLDLGVIVFTAVHDYLPSGVLDAPIHLDRPSAAAPTVPTPQPVADGTGIDDSISLVLLDHGRGVARVDLTPAEFQAIKAKMQGSGLPLGKLLENGLAFMSALNWPGNELENAQRKSNAMFELLLSHLHAIDKHAAPTDETFVAGCWTLVRDVQDNLAKACDASSEYMSPKRQPAAA